MTTIAMNLSNRALSQYTDFDYDSMEVFNEDPIGGNSNGIFKLEQDSHDQAQIDAYFLTGLMDFGAPNQKRIRSVVLGGEVKDDETEEEGTEGDVQLTITSDEDTDKSITMYFNKKSLKLSGSKGYSVRSQVGRYYQFKIANLQGVKFGIERIDVIPVILNAKPRGI